MLILCGGSDCFLSNVCVFMYVCVHLQEWKRGEANGLAYAAQRQLPCERRPQGKSKACMHKSVSTHIESSNNKLITHFLSD